MIRVLDILLALTGLMVGFPLLAVLWLIGLVDTGSPIFRQIRVGRNQKPFMLIKFRTMRLDTDSVATHMVNATAVTRLGRLLRRSKLDELPQLWNVLKGEMSLVGPRPCLPNQEALIAERALRGVFDFRPGITGLAQVQGIDMSTPRLLAETDAQMLETMSLYKYCRYISLTVLGKGVRDGIGTSVER